MLTFVMSTGAHFILASGWSRGEQRIVMTTSCERSWVLIGRLPLKTSPDGPVRPFWKWLHGERACQRTAGANSAEQSVEPVRSI